jgi:addiction module HigA family antidote
VKKNGMRPVHPGEVLREDVLKEIGLSAAAFARKLNVPTNRVTEILNGERAVSAETALRLARCLGGTPQFWLNLQTNYDLRRTEIEQGERIAREVKALTAA